MNTHANISEKEANLDANRHGLICVIILVIGCLGGITIGYRAIESVVALTLVVLPTMTTLSLLLAVAPMKWIIKMATVSVVIDLIILSYYFFIG